MKVSGLSQATLHRTVFLAIVLTSVFLLFSYRASAEVVRTGYTSIVAVNSAKCLDIYSGSSAPGAAAIQWHCDYGTNEQWTVQNYNGGFRIIERQTADCLVIAGGSTSAGAQLVQQPCSGVKSELWSFVPNSGNFQIVSASSGQCASVSGASTADLAYIVQEPCTTAANFLWTFSSGLITSSSLSVLQAAHSGQCLNVSGSSTSVGGVIIQYPCAGSTNEQWTLSPSGAYYELIANNSSLCLSNNGSTASGANIVQSTCSAAATSDLWALTPIGGSYELIANNSGLCATVPGATQVPATTVVQSACTGVQNQLWSLSAATIPSSWTSVVQLAVDPIAVGNLPNGQLVMWSANDQYTFEGDIGYGNGQTYTAVFDPVSLVSTQILVTNTGDDMFCPGTANLFNGNILVNGGDSSPKTSLYNPTSGLWTSDADMNIPRGYEGDTVLTNGSVMTLGGSWSGGEGGKTAEVWTEGSGWTVLSNVPETSIIGPDPQGVYRGDNHLWMFSAPNGEVFHAGPSAQMHWITTSGAGTITSAGNRGNDPYAINGNAVLYDIGLIMKTGGAQAYQDANAEANTYLIDINNGVPGVTVTELAPMAYPRAFANGVVLPNGQVLIIGGQTYPVPFDDATAILIPEIWDPLTQVFRQLNPMQTPRVYHSTGILLSDGRVYEGGGGQCGVGCSANHFNTEILTPPYLLNADGSAATRPVIASASSTVALGGAISATTSSPVASFVLMRLSSVTHTVNNDQRRIPLQMQSTNGTSYTLAVPSNAGIVLPGNYWLFALTAQGVPSVAANVVVTLGVPTAGFQLSTSPSTLTITQGASATSTITVADMGGFSGSVTLAASGLPAGVTASFATNPATVSSVLTLTAGSSAAVGTSTVTITGTSGTLTASTTIALTITAASCTPTPITPYIQVNSAAWQQVSTATVASGSTVNLGPQPLGGTWSWAGPNGFASTAREIDNISLITGADTFVATYTNASSCKSTQAFVVTVTGGSFTLSPSASSISVTQGGSATDTITVTDAGGFTGSVTLSASGLPSGVTATFATNPTTGSSVLTLSASGSAATGTSTVTITGTSGSLTATTIIALTVNQNCTSTPITPYIQVNSAAWQQVSSVTVAAGSTVNLGPQPLGGTWNWTGPNGFTSTAREIDKIPLSTGANTFVATYTSSSACKSNETFVVTLQ